MAEDIEVPVVHSAQDAFGLRIPAKSEPRMDRANCVIQFFEEIVGIVERVVGQDVELTRFENTKTPRSAIQLVDKPDLLPEILDRNATCDLQTLRVVADADIVVAALRAAAIASIESLPSLAIVWVCRSPENRRA
jgi:hypothetical protein